MTIQTEQTKICFDNVHLLLTEYGYTLELNNHANQAIAPNLDYLDYICGSNLPESGDRVALGDMFAFDLETNSKIYEWIISSRT